jgi:TolB protein
MRLLVAVAALVAPALLAGAAAPSPASVHNGLLVFVVDHRNSESTQIWTATATGTKAHRLTPRFASYDSPRWSPNGKRILYTRSPDSNVGDLYTMDANGKHVREVSFTGTDFEAAWSPDGRQIAFTSGLDSGTSPLYTMDAVGTNRRAIVADQAELDGAAWSPDGTRIAYQAYFFGAPPSPDEIWTVAPDGGDPQELSQPGVAYDDDWPAWSPDGRQVAFVSDRSGDSDIWVMNADGTNPHDLTNHPANDVTPTWSPDGRKIAFASDRAEKNHLDIYLMNSDGTHLRRVTRGLGADAFEPDWQPLR